MLFEVKKQEKKKGKDAGYQQDVHDLAKAKEKAKASHEFDVCAAQDGLTERQFS